MTNILLLSLIVVISEIIVMITVTIIVTAGRHAITNRATAQIQKALMAVMMHLVPHSVMMMMMMIHLMTSSLAVSGYTMTKTRKLLRHLVWVFFLSCPQ